MMIWLVLLLNVTINYPSGQCDGRIETTPPLLTEYRIVCRAIFHDGFET